jgi:hypothetical protein
MATAGHSQAGAPLHSSRVLASVYGWAAHPGSQSDCVLIMFKLHIDQANTFVTGATTSTRTFPYD